MEPKPPISIKNYKEKKKEMISYIFFYRKLVLFKMFLNKKKCSHVFSKFIFFLSNSYFLFFFFNKNHHFLYQNLKKINIEMMQNSENG